MTMMEESLDKKRIPRTGGTVAGATGTVLTEGSPLGRSALPPGYPAGEMIQERMEWDSPWQNTIREEMDRDWRGFYEVPPFIPSPAELADIGRTTTMGTGWGRQPLIDPPPTYDYAGTGGLGGLPLSPFIPNANTLLPPVNQEMIGNWGGGAANRQEWTGPLAVSPFTNPWSMVEGHAFTPTSEFYNYENPNWRAVQKDRRFDRLNSMQNFATNYGLPALAGLATMGMSLPYYNPWQNTPWNR
jgi:hypothetical protein